MRLLLIALFALLTTHTLAASYADPQPVAIEGYEGHAMEPFLTRDGRYLLFNDSNAPGANTDLHIAEQHSDLRFRYVGRLKGANSEKLDGVASMDRDGTVYFVSLRSYEQSLATIYRGYFSNGEVRDIQLVAGLSRKTPGLVNFDAEISADGQFIYAVDGEFGILPVPKSADIFIARRSTEGFVRLSDSDRMLAAINTPALEYAPAISADSLQLCFTRMTGFWLWPKLAILCATRRSPDEPFDTPIVVDAIDGFVEAPSFGVDGRSLYYHRKVDGIHSVWRVVRQ